MWSFMQNLSFERNAQVVLKRREKLLGLNKRGRIDEPLLYLQYISKWKKKEIFIFSVFDSTETVYHTSGADFKTIVNKY